MMFSFYDQLVIYLCEIRDRVRLIPRLVTRSRGLARLDTVWYQQKKRKFTEGIIGWERNPLIQRVARNEILIKTPTERFSKPTSDITDIGKVVDVLWN